MVTDASRETERETREENKEAEIHHIKEPKHHSHEVRDVVSHTEIFTSKVIWLGEWGGGGVTDPLGQ